MQARYSHCSPSSSPLVPSSSSYSPSLPAQSTPAPQTRSISYKPIHPALLTPHQHRDGRFGITAAVTAAARLDCAMAYTQLTHWIHPVAERSVLPMAFLHNSSARGSFSISLVSCLPLSSSVSSSLSARSSPDWWLSAPESARLSLVP